MAKAKGIRPFIAGGGTLSKMGRKGGSSHSGSKKKAVWFELNGKTYGSQGKLTAWPVGEMPAELKARLAPGGSK
jgi:hypothetical protein